MFSSNFDPNQKMQNPAIPFNLFGGNSNPVAAQGQGQMPLMGLPEEEEEMSLAEMFAMGQPTSRPAPQAVQSRGLQDPRGGVQFQNPFGAGSGAQPNPAHRQRGLTR